MLRLNTMWRITALLSLLLVAQAPVALAADESNNGDTKATASDEATKAATPDPGTTTTPAPIEEQLKQQAAVLQRMQELLQKQQAEIERLRTELDAVRTKPAVDTVAPAEGDATATVATVPASATEPRSATPAATEDADLAKRVDNIEKLWGNFKLSGDLRFRAESLWNQGFDALNDVNSRNRLRVRARVQLTSKINDHFDWGIRVASGSLDDPTSTNQTLTTFFDRKPIAIDRAFLHFQTDTKPGNLEIYAGKFDPTWKKTSLTFDPDVQVEGVSERVRVKLGDDTPLRGLSFTAWQLPIAERSTLADAYIFGGQVLTEWQWNDNWTSSLAGTFHDFEQANVIPSALGVSSTLINAGLEYGTTNTLFLDPVTGLPQFRSKFRAIDVLGDLSYRGFGPRAPVTLTAEWLHNTSAFNNQKDGGYAQIAIGRKKEQGDFEFDYNFYKAEREVFPSVFMESDVGIQTNSVAHWFGFSYMLQNKVQFQSTYFLTRRLQTTSPENRWLNRFQLDMIYSF